MNLYRPDHRKRPEPPSGLLDPTKWPWLIGVLWVLGLALGEWFTHRPPPNPLPRDAPAQTAAQQHRD